MTRSLRVLLWIAVPLSVVTIYFLFDPLQSRWMPRCMFHTLTGLECPGCGSQRMIHALLHGDIAGAWRHNAFLLCLTPWLLLLGLTETGIIRNKSFRKALHSIPAVGIICLAIILWTVLRNI